ncbi:MAG: MBL fold metallo-hydrolase [Phycisphaerales bacterium]|nr:MBL fold metallo-hydrolase [Phycisphaerales bacterium]
MRMIVTGVGDAFSVQSFGSSSVVEAPTGLVAIDCPGHALAMYDAASRGSGVPIRVDRIDDILLTHLHGDHSNGLEAIGFMRRFLGDAPRRPRVHALPEVIDRLWEKLAPGMDGNGNGLEDYFDPMPLEPGKPRRVAGLEVECRRARHSIPTAGFLIADDAGSIGWSGDTEFEQAHIDWLSQASIIVHECGEQFKHTAWTELDGLPEAVKARVRLIHIPDGTTTPEGPMRPLAQGEILEP